MDSSPSSPPRSQSRAFVAADTPGKQHPAYLARARRSARRTRASSGRSQTPSSSGTRTSRFTEIDAAIKEIKDAALDDGKNLNDHPPVDVAMDWKGRLHRSLELDSQGARRHQSGRRQLRRARPQAPRVAAHGCRRPASSKRASSTPSRWPACRNAPTTIPRTSRALSDMREARALLQRPAKAAKVQVGREHRTIREIDGAIKAIKVAALDDGKNLDDHPPIDAGMDYGSRLQRADELIAKARAGHQRRRRRQVRARPQAQRAAAPRRRRCGDQSRHRQRQGAREAPGLSAHALDDLRAARAHLERPSNVVVKWDGERAAPARSKPRSARSKSRDRRRQEPERSPRGRCGARLGRPLPPRERAASTGARRRLERKTTNSRAA